MYSRERARFGVRTRFRELAVALLFLSPMALATWVFVSSVIAGRASIGTGLFLLLFGFLLTHVLRTKTRSWMTAPGAYVEAEIDTSDDMVTVTAEGVALQVTKKKVRRGWVQPRGTGAEVVLEASFGRCDIYARDIAFAREILASVGHAPKDRPLTLAFSGGLRVTVGVDGVLVAWPILRRKRFVPHARIRQIRTVPGVVVLELDDGGQYEIATGTDQRAIELRDALVERLQEAQRAYRASEGTDTTLLLGRAGRTVDAWVREARALTSGAGGQYRSAAPPPEVLWRIVSDPTEDEDKRVGASLALRGVLDDEGRARLRVAAEAAASPRVRVALNASAEEADDEAVAEKIRAGAKARETYGQE